MVPDDLSLADLPTGYVYHPESVAAVRSAYGASPDDFAGATQQRMNDEGLHYCNLTQYAADYLRRGGVVTSRRELIDCGSDGVVLAPLAQQTGICDGCSFGEAAFIAWCAAWVMTGIGRRPVETAFLWPYLAGRVLSITGRGDTGACPPYSAQLYHQVGVLPVNCGGKFNLADLPPHGPNSQEMLCIQMRDNPSLRPEWADAAAGLKCRIYPPQDQWSVADCITTGRPVTCGCQWQMNKTSPPNGVSTLYKFPNNGGHETFLSGWFTMNGRLNFIKTESWWGANYYPGSNWPGHRVQVQTDEGPKLLYPGQGAIDAAVWMAKKPECWAIDAPGSVP